MASRPVRALLSTLVLAACGDSADTQQEPAETNDPPVWSDAPSEPVAVGQGQGVVLPVVIDDETAGDVVVSVPSPPDGLEVELVVGDAGAQELSLRAGYAVSGPVAFDVVLDDGKDTTTVTVNVEIAPLRWLSNEAWSEPDGPAAREHGSVVVDVDGGQAFLFGGSGYSPYLEPLDDAWRYDLASGAWSPVTPTGDVPDAGGSRRVAHVPGTKTAYMFGGYGGAQGSVINDDLYRVTVEGQGLSFKLLTQNDPPTARSLHAFAYDPGSERFVVFGGAGNALFGDTWIMTLDGDVANWTKLDPETSPSKRYGFFAGMDAERGRLLLFSGQTSQTAFADDTWALDMRAEPPVWELLSEGGGASDPPGRRNGGTVFDPSSPRLFVFGGTSDGATTQPGLFAFDARPGKSVWTKLELDNQPDVRSSCFGFYDSESGQSLLGFGNTASAVFSDWGVIGY